MIHAVVLLAALAQLGVRTDKTRVEVGEPFRLTIVATAQAGRSLDLVPNLPLGDKFDELERTEAPPVQRGAEVQKSWIVTMVALEAGPQQIPALPVLVGGDGGGRVETTPQGIEVTSVVGDGKDVELRPIAAPVTIYRRDWTMTWIAGAALVGLVVLVLAVRGLRRVTRKSAAEAAPPPLQPAEVVALGRLRVVEEQVRGAPDPRPAHFEMSEIVREYIGRRWGVDALERTTDELAEVLARTPDVDAAVRTEVVAWLAARDMVKFARVSVDKDASLAAVKEAVAFVEKTKPRPAPEVPRA